MWGMLGEELIAFEKTIRKKFSDLKISIRFALFYFVVLIVSIGLSNMLYQQIYSNIALKKVSDISIQTLYSIKTSLNLLINNVNTYSKLILSDNDLQFLLRNKSIYSDLNAQGRVGTYLNKLIQEFPVISSVYIFDDSGNEYSISNQGSIKFEPSRVQDAVWYDSVVKNKGAYILSLNGGGAFQRNPEDNFVSMIRLIRDVNTTKAMGVLIINISENAFKDSYANIVSNYSTGITILDENQKSIVKLNEIDQNEVNNLISGFKKEEHGFEIVTLKKMEYLVSYLFDNEMNWKIVSVMPMKELSNETSTSGLIGFAIILINSLFLFIGSIFTSRMVTIPIKKLLKSMKGVGNSEFLEVDIRAGDNEIGKLRDGYNIMIRQIKELINRVITEQKIKRKAELNVLQAQIKPHFLYNTLDSINSLVLSGERDSVCKVVDALGNYYRLSLSKGKEIITVGEEIEMVSNYLKIQKVRYVDMFSAKFDLDEQCNEYKILKLVLQPLVENALYHGIRAKGESGTITIETRHMTDHIRISVADDGVGMSEEDIHRIMAGNIGTGDISFGLRGTIERLRIFYGVDDCLRIESGKGAGTKVTIIVPVKTADGEEKHG